MLPHIICTGSYEFLPYAKSKGRQVLANAKLLGGNGNIRETLPNGGTLNITVALPSTYRIILTDGGVDVLSGAVAPGDYISYQDPVTTKTLYAIDSFEPSSLQVAGNPPLPRDWRQEKKLGDNDRYYFTADRFTGKMRMAMQLFYGTKHDPEEYRSDFYVSHGIHVDLNGGKWLIEVSAYGVLAKPLGGKPIKASKEIREAAKAAGMSVVPSGKAFYRDPVEPDFKQPDYTKFKTLLSPQSIQAAFYNTNIVAIHRGIGWAFNYSGSKVSNVALWLENGNIKSGLFTIDIASDESGPTSATITIVESGYFKDHDVYFAYGQSDFYYVKTNTVSYGRGNLHGFPNQHNMELTSVSKTLKLTGPAFCYYDNEHLMLWHCESKDYVSQGSGSPIRYSGFIGPGITTNGNPRESIVVNSQVTSPDGPLQSFYGGPPPVVGDSANYFIKFYAGLQNSPPYGSFDYVTLSFYAIYEVVTDIYDGGRQESTQTGLDCYRSVNFSGVNRESAYVYQHDNEYGGLSTSSGQAFREFRFSNYAMIVSGTNSGNPPDSSYVADQFARAMSELSPYADGVNRARVITASRGYWRSSSQAPLLSISTLGVFNHDELTSYADLGTCANVGVAEYCGKSAFLGSSYHHRLVAVFKNGGYEYSTVNVFHAMDGELFAGHVGEPKSYSFPNRLKFGYPLSWVGYS